jgi:hypothetical protein
MTLKIEALSAATEKGKLNSEWMLLVNETERPFNTEGCSITVSRGGSPKGRVVTTLKAGLIIQPKERCRVVTGSSGRGSHGEAPVEEGVRNVHLYLKAPYLEKPGLVVKLMNKQHEVCRATFDPEATGGVAAAKE